MNPVVNHQNQAVIEAMRELETRNGAILFENAIEQLRLASQPPIYDESLHPSRAMALEEMRLHQNDFVRGIGGLMSEALSHIKRVAENSRSGSRRLRWIIQRAEWALAGKPYDRDQFSLPETKHSYRYLQNELALVKARYEFCRNGDIDLLGKYAKAGELPTGEEFDRIVDLSIAEAAANGEQS